MISYPLSMPSSPKPMTATFEPFQAVASTQSPFSGAQQFQRWDSQLWQVHVELPPIKDRETAEDWIGWMLAQRAGYGTFTMGQPLGTAPMGVATGTPLVNGANSSGAETLDTKGWTTGVTGILKRGDLLQLGTGSTARLHKVLATVDSDGSGNATLDIFPRLRADYSDGATIVLTSPVGLFRLMPGSSGGASWSIDSLAMYGVAFDCIEALTA